MCVYSFYPSPLMSNFANAARRFASYRPRKFFVRAKLRAKKNIK